MAASGFFRRPTFLEWPVIVAILAVAYALFLMPDMDRPSFAWLPFVIQVFDARAGTPIEGADVRLFRGPLPEMENVADGRLAAAEEWGGPAPTLRAMTGADGRVKVLYPVPRDPRPRLIEFCSKETVYPNRIWVRVSAKEYGEAALPAGSEPIEFRSGAGYPTVNVTVGLAPPVTRKTD